MTPFQFSLSEINGQNGFRILEPSRYSSGIFSKSVTGLGDINNDGIDDIAIGDPWLSSDPVNYPNSQDGIVYVVFGKEEGFGPDYSLDDLNGANGFAIESSSLGESPGWSISNAGDINDDGINDLLIGETFANRSHVVFGSSMVFHPA